jgi:hypothetical protein
VNVIFVGGHGFLHPHTGDTIAVFHEFTAYSKEKKEMMNKEYAEKGQTFN